MTSKTKRYNLVLPMEQYKKLEKTASDRNISVVDVIRMYLRVGEIVDRNQNNPNGGVFILEHDKYKQIIVVL